MPINWNAVANGGQKEEPPEPVVEQGPAVKEVKEPDPVPEMVVTKETGVKIIEKPFFNEAFPQAPAAIIGLDPEAVKPLLEVAKARFQREIAEMETAVEVAENFLVVDDRTHKEAIKNAGAIKKMLKALDVERKDVIGGADAFVRGVNAFIKIFKDMSNKAVNQYSRKCSTYSAKVEAERRKREAEAKKQAEEMQAKIDADAKAGGYEAPKVEFIPETRESSVVRTESGASAHTRKVWTFEIEDLEKVPGKYKVVDDKVVNADIRAGVRNIPGLKIYQKETTVFKD